MINLKTTDWEIKNVETILFDKDGTFIDLHFFWGKMTELRAKEIIRRFNCSADIFGKLCSYLGYDLISNKMLADGITALYSRSKIIEIFQQNLLQENIKTSTEELEEIFDYISEKFYKNMFEYTMPIPSAIEFIKNVRKHNIKLGIVTSDSQKSTLLTLKQFNWEELFDTVIGRESSCETKESGIPTQIALKELNAYPETTIMIGDAPMDYISAHNANIKNTILVATGQLQKEELIKTSPYTVNSLNEIKIIH